MSAIDFIRGGKAKGIRQKKVDETWNVVSGSLNVGGQDVGPVVWERSSYLKKGANVNFYAYVSGTMFVCPEVKREGYVPPPTLKWGMPIPEHSDDEDDGQE